MAKKQKNKFLKRIRESLRLKLHRFQRLSQNKWFKLATYPLIALAFLTVAILILNPIIFPPIKNYNFGVSFSEKRSVELGLDWQENYIALLDDLKIRNFRLMSYWDMHEQTRGQMDFTSLDWQMDEAAKRGAKVSLAIGNRQPRWPECHQPEWAGKLTGHEWKQALYAYTEVVVKRYENHPALESWQLENEALNEWFGECDKPDVERINEEFALVKSWTKKPVLMSLSDQHGLPFRAPVPDAYGYSVYRIVYSTDGILQNSYMWYPTPLWYHRARAVVLKAVWDRPLFVHELQLEPWGPIDTQHLSAEEQNISMSYDQIHHNVTFARQIGFEDIYTWGGEWWYWRKEARGDHAVWEAVRREIISSRQ